MDVFGQNYRISNLISVGSEVDSDVSLNDYLREFLNLRGTKYMCKEGGCGACIVSVTLPDVHNDHRKVFSVNSVSFAIFSSLHLQFN